jgi:hypothetical protein
MAVGINVKSLIILYQTSLTSWLTSALYRIAAIVASSQSGEAKMIALNEDAFREPRVEQLPGTFPELLSQSTGWDDEFRELAGVSVEHVEVTPKTLIVGENSVLFGENARHRLLERAGAPVSYLAKRSIDIQMLALREHISQQVFGGVVVPVIRGGKLFTLNSGHLTELTIFEVISAVADALGASAGDLTVSRITHADGRLEVDLASSAKSLAIRPGDLVKGGLHIEHSRYRGEATHIYAFVYRLVCANGMTRRECVSAEGIVRTRKLPGDHPRAKELLLDQIRRLTARTWERLEMQLAELRATSEKRANVEQILRQWLLRARISTRVTRGNGDESRTVLDRLLAAWRAEGADSTIYAAVNALTSVGSHDFQLSARQRRVLSSLGGLLAFSGLHICPRCFAALPGPAPEPGETGSETTG